MTAQNRSLNGYAITRIVLSTNHLKTITTMNDYIELLVITSLETFIIVVIAWGLILWKF